MGPVPRGAGPISPPARKKPKTPSASPATTFTWRFTLLGGELDWHVLPSVLATVFAFLIAGLSMVGLRQQSSPEA